MIAILALFAAGALLLPLLVRVLGVRVFWVAALFPLAGFIHALLLAPRVFDGDIPFEEYHWIPALDIDISMRMDALSWVMTLIVTGVGALVMIYCRVYFRGSTSGLGRFSAVLLAFAGAMYGLVLTDDAMMLVLFWEMTSILSYLLIGHSYTRAASRRAALQALLVTTAGGLAMFVGMVVLRHEAGASSLSGILAAAPSGTATDVALVLVLMGAVSKSALFPFHFWLPGAMAAPTPVSAYLHAAAMVKAGIYLLARFAPTFDDHGPWRPVIVSLGIVTMLLGGFQALRERDLKRILAYGTVSQLGLIAVVIGFGERDTALAGLALVVSHALFKSCLFLVVGIIDRQLGTRDVRELSGIGRQAPVLATISVVAVAAMIGLPPTIGFVAKEAALTALHESGSPWATVALIGVVAGSIFTVAYGVRFLWGAFLTKRSVAPSEWPDPPLGFLASPLVLSALALAAGFASPLLDRALAGYAGAGDDHLALWHGPELALSLSLVTLIGGAGVFALAQAIRWDARGRLLRFGASDAYYALTRGIDRLSVAVTSLTQSGSLPVYVGTIFVVLVASQGTALVWVGSLPVRIDVWQNPAQLIAAPVMIVAGLLAVRVRKRYTGVVLVSVTGLGMIVLFAVSGAPDLALTQVLVESVTLIAFTLVLRRIPARIGTHNPQVARIARAVLAGFVGLTMAVIVIVTASARIHEPISTDWAELAYTGGHGANVVNVTLVDLRGWDTMGEITVLVLAATGIASLVFVTERGEGAIKSPARGGLRRVLASRPLRETSEGARPQTAENRGAPLAWLAGGTRMATRSRSILLEVVVRLVFPSIMVLSIYLLFAGHNLPGGGFAGGLVAGMALVMRYIAGGRYELGIAAPVNAGHLLGAGVILAVGTAVMPLAFGHPPLESTVWEAHLPLVGHIEFVSSTIFDIGVYLVVIGLVLDVLRSLGAEVDRQLREEVRG
ncbi:MAG: Na+/H+ antiporter subunit A [Microbacterium sp.]